MSLPPDHTMVVDGDGVSTADHRAIAFKELHDLQAGGSDLSREFDGRAIAEFGIDNRHFRCMVNLLEKTQCHQD
mgnify:CR=1 FL=1